MSIPLDVALADFPAASGSLDVDDTVIGFEDGTAVQATPTQVGAGGGGGGGATELDHLTDVVITAAASGDILRHNGTAFVDTPGTTHFDAAGSAAAAQTAAEATAAAGLALKADKAQAINTQTGTTYTLVLADDGKYVRCTNAAGCTVTVPLNSRAAFPTGARVEGAATLGATTIVATGGVTINKARTLVTNGAMSGWSLLKVGTNEWDLHGDFV
jgi:hypothetical protein